MQTDPQATRKIIHVDMDAFYASVEQRDRPELRGKPVVVGGSPDSRGVVAAASYEARKFGIHSAMPMSQAVRRCAELVIVRPRFTVYREVSQQVRAIFDEYSDVVEPLSLDEAFLDVTDDKAGLGSARAAAEAIRRRVREELNLTCSAGVSSVKFVAKIASDFDKPDGLTVVPPDRILAFVHPLPVRRLWGVGPATEARLHELGIRTVGDLAARDPADVHRLLGSHGEQLWRMAHGEDPRPVQSHRPRRSRSSETTFAEDVQDVAVLERVLSDQADGVCRGLEAAGLVGRTVTLKLRYDDFTTITRSETLPEATCDPRRVFETARELLARTEAAERPVRLVGVGLANLEEPTPSAQIPLPLDYPED